MFGGANQVTGICGCLVAKAISWSSRRQEPGQHSLWGDVDTLRGEVAITCPPGRVWGWELLWQAAHLQIDACAHPRVKREWAISSLEQEALPAEFVLHMKGGELSQCPKRPQRVKRNMRGCHVSQGQHQRSSNH